MQISISLSYWSSELLDTFLDNVLGIGGKQWYKAYTEFHERIWEVKVQEVYKVLFSLIIVHIEQWFTYFPKSTEARSKHVRCTVIQIQIHTFYVKATIFADRLGKSPRDLRS